MELHLNQARDEEHRAQVPEFPSPPARAIATLAFALLVASMGPLWAQKAATEAADQQGTVASETSMSSVVGEAPPTSATPAESKSGQSPPVAHDSEDSKEVEPAEIPIGRLLITTDAAATIWIDGLSLGELQPGEALEHEVNQPDGKVKAVAVEAVGAQIEKPYSFDSKDEEAGADGEETKSDEAADTQAAEEPTESTDTDDPVELEQLEIHFRMAKAIRTLRKSERQDKIYPDFKDAVMWAREDNRTNVTWNAANEYCSELDLGGNRDWRLPNLEELSGIQVMWSQNPLKTIDPIRLTDCCPWSSTEIDDQHAWNFNYRFRKAFKGRKGHSFGMRALCVRDLTAEDIAEHEAAVVERERIRKEEKKEEKKRKKALKRSGEQEDPSVDSEPEVDDSETPYSALPGSATPDTPTTSSGEPPPGEPPTH